MHRRRLLGLTAGCIVAAQLPKSAGAFDAGPQSQRTELGLVIYCQRFQRDLLQREDAALDLYEPKRFLEHCFRLGAGGMQAALGVRDQDYVAELRDKAERSGMRVEAIIKPPESASDRDRFEAEMRTARDAGALCARTVIIPGRRYEQFTSLEEFRAFATRGQRMLEAAAPIAEKYRLPLAVENHKDQRIDERLALFEHIDSEYVGACVDTGNSVALLEDAQQTVEALAPWAHSVHLKDQAVQEYEEGFLLADIPLGQGIFDLSRMVEVLRRAKPGIGFMLELITRDPLRVPCLTDAYWATFPDLPGRDLARTLRTVRARGAEALPQVESLPLEQQVEREAANVRASLDYASQQLRI